MRSTPPLRALPLALLAAVVALAVTACSSGESAASLIGISPEAFTRIVEGEEDFLRPAGEQTTDAWIGYVDGDQVVRIGDGGTIPFGDLEIQFSVSPYPPTDYEVVAELAITGPGGAPADVTVEAWYDMIFMNHGQPTVEIEPVGEGEFRMPLDLFMFGPWVVKATVIDNATTRDLALVIYVWP